MFKKTLISTVSLIIIIIFLTLITHIPINKTFEYNFDEGTNIIKSTLILNGYSLYKEIIDDQPPLFMIILTYWLKIFGTNIPNGRILVLIFSFLLLSSFYGTIKIYQGKVCALTAVIFLILSNIYLKASISLMIDIPALSTAMISIYYLTLFKKTSSKNLLILSALFFAVSLQIKLYAVFLLPLVIYELIKGNPAFLISKKHTNLTILTIWITSFLLSYIPLILIFFSFDFLKIFQYLLYPHAKMIRYPGNNFLIILKSITKDYDFFLLAIAGCILIIKQKLQKSVFPILWLTIATLILINHSPLWEHYYLLISIPICWLAAIAFNYFSRNFISVEA